MIRIQRVLAPNPGIRELEGSNTWIVGRGHCIVVDPGPDNTRHLEEVRRAAGRVGAIVVTHHHPDHAPGAVPLAASTGAPVFALRPPPGGERLRDGQTVRSGGAVLVAIGSPGHTADHVAFLEEPSGSLFAGDAVLGRGTSVIDPPEGDLVRYLRSLRRMRDLAPRTIYPGHGPVVLDAVGKLEEYLAHRALREEQVLAGLADGAHTPEELVPTIYGDHAEAVHPLAARTVLAHLLKLEREGRAERRSRGRYALAGERACARCGRPVRGRARLCGPCSLAALQE